MTSHDQHTFNKVVIASVAILRLLSVINVSKSMLHDVTDVGCSMAIRDNVFAAAYLIVGLGEPRNSCKTAYRINMLTPG